MAVVGVVVAAVVAAAEEMLPVPVQQVVPAAVAEVVEDSNRVSVPSLLGVELFGHVLR